MNRYDGYEGTHRVMLSLLRACFAEADVDGDGFITLAEFKIFMDRQKIVLPGEQSFTDVVDKRDVRSGLQLLAFAKHDTNRDFVLDFDEFKNFVLQMLAPEDRRNDATVDERGVEEDLFRVLANYFFSKADTDRDGLVSANEIREVT